MIRGLLLLLLSAMTAEATVTVTDRGTGTSTAAGTTFNVAGALTGGGMTAGNLGVLCLSLDNSNGASLNLPSGRSITDSKGNVWYRREYLGGGSANANVEGAIFTSQLTSNLTSSDTLTITTVAGTTPTKSWAFIEMSTNVTGAQVFYLESSNTSQSATTSPTMNNNAYAANNGEVTLGVMAVEYEDDLASGDADTTAGNWSSPAQHAGVGTTAGGNSIVTQWKVQNAYSTQTWNPLMTAAMDARELMATFTENANAKTITLGGAGITGTSYVAAINMPMAIGTFGVLCLAADNQGSSGTGDNLPTAALTDSQGNSWTRRQRGVQTSGIAGTGTEIGLWTSVLTTALTIGDTLTIGTFPTTIPVKVVAIYGFPPAGAGSMTYVTSGLGTGVTASTSPTVNTTSIASGNYVVGMTGSEETSLYTPDTDTSNGTWSAQSAVARGSAGAAGQQVTAQWKKVTAAGAQTYNVTVGAATDSIQAWVEINDSSPTGLTAAQKGAFFQLLR